MTVHSGPAHHGQTLRPMDEPKKCWICFGDSTEDIPDSTSSWRSPCPCALTAHESCLLDWIADLEASSPASRHRSRRDRIECPQCKAEIRVARPWSPTVVGVRALERVASASVVPGIVSILLGGVTSACFVHGAMSIFLILGPKDWEKLVRSTNGQITRGGLTLMAGLPMVPLILVLSRTKLADGFFPVLPFLFLGPQITTTIRRWNSLVEQAGTDSPAGLGISMVAYEKIQLWPPTAVWTFAALPYVRAAYNAGYARLFAKKEKEWLRAVQRAPRPGETEEQVIQGQADQEGGNVEIQAEIIFGGNEDEERDPADVQVALNAAVEQVEERQGRDRVRIDQAEGFNEEIQQIQHQPQNNNNNNNNNNNGLIVSASKVADTVLGALCFPAIASLMGEVLKLSLPAKLTAETQARRPGVLHTKWGRSLVGGCLFIVMKDALVLYSRYRLAQDHKKRRILDYDGPRPRSAET